MKTKHTPTPWHHAKPFTAQMEGRGKCRFIGIGNGASHIGYASITDCVPLDEAKANAQFITLACNHHEELVEALQDELGALGIWACASGLPNDVYDGIQISRSKIKSLLTKLKG